MSAETRWASLHDFIAQWHRPLTPEDGVPPEEMNTVEERFGRKLPEAVREWYERAGRFTEITDRQNHLVPPSEMVISSYAEPIEGQDDTCAFPVGLEVCNENQYVYGWKILETDLYASDPPVYLEDPDNVLGEERLYREADTFSEFISKSVALETLYAPAYDDRRSHGTASVENVRMTLSEQYTSLSDTPLCRGAFFWKGDDILLGTLDEGGSFVLIAATRERLARAKADLGDLIVWTTQKMENIREDI
ncbi:MAG: SMI1/KNR4 family protein [Capsulimonadales bacterium]|nr:SMI1/KNR4 family protein [Capsulimonadales bacterium]